MSKKSKTIKSTKHSSNIAIKKQISTNAFKKDYLNFNFIILGTLALASLIVIIVFALNLIYREPEIMRHYACDDYCPGPTDQYWIDIYKDVSDSRKCRELGGALYTYGLNRHVVCQVIHGQTANE
jgi:hypothetical protein